MPKVEVKIDDRFFKFLKLWAQQERTEESGVLAKLIEREYERKLREFYEQFQRGEISLGYLAREMGLARREAEEVLEKRGLRVTNI